MQSLTTDIARLATLPDTTALLSLTDATPAPLSMVIVELMPRTSAPLSDAERGWFVRGLAALVGGACFRVGLDRFAALVPDLGATQDLMATLRRHLAASALSSRIEVAFGAAAHDPRRRPALETAQAALRVLEWDRGMRSPRTAAAALA